MKKIVSLLLSLVLLLSTVPLFTVSAAAATAVEVTTGAALKDYLAKNGDYTIKVTKKIRYNYKQKAEDFAKLGTGTKTLDLNGQTIEIGNDYNTTSAFDTSAVFNIGPGAKLIVNNSVSGGTVKSDGTLHNYDHINYQKCNRSVRNIFAVTGGTLVVNGGTFEAGRSKKDYNADAAKNEYQQINGSAVMISGGSTVIINGGSFYGRGWRATKARCAGICLYDSKSTLTINNAHVYGNGGANTIGVEFGGKVTVFSGIFENNVQDLAIDVYSYFKMNSSVSNHPKQGSLGLENSMLADNCQAVADGKSVDFSNDHLENYTKKIVVSPTKRTVAIKVPNDDWFVRVSRYGTKGKVFTATGFTPHFKLTDSGVPIKHTMMYEWSVYEKGKPSATLKLKNGNDSLLTTSSTFDIYQQLDCTKLTANKNYTVKVTAAEFLFSTDYYPLSATATADFTALDKKMPVVSSQPITSPASAKGGEVSVRAVIDNVDISSGDTVKWYKVEKGTVTCLGDATAGSQSFFYYSGTVDSEYGIYAVAQTPIGSVTTSTVKVGYIPQFTGAAQTVSVQQNDKIFLTIPSDADNCGRLKSKSTKTGWYRVVNEASKLYERVDGDKAADAYKGRTSVSGETLTITGARSSDAQQYVRIIEYLNADGETKEIISPAVTVTVTENSSLITSLMIDGYTAPTYGELPCQKDALIPSSDKYTVESVTWTGVDYLDKVINSTNPSVSIVLKAKSGYQFWFDDTGYIRCMLGNWSTAAYGTANSGEDTITVSKTYDNHTPVYQPYDRFTLTDNAIEIMAGTKVNVQLGINILCDDQHTTKHKKAYNVKLASGALPEGLAIDASGNITGTTTAEGTYTFKLYADNGEEKNYNKSVEWGLGPITLTVIPHVHDYIIDESTNTATCSKGGTVKAVCKHAAYCGGTTVSLPTEATGAHIYASAVKIDGTYHNAVCADCGETVKEQHTWVTDETQNATLKKNGYVRFICSACGAVKETAISRPKTFKLAKTAYVYTGKAIKPAVTVKDAAGKVIDKANYTVTYSNNKKVGLATVKIVFKGDYTGTKKLTFKINPKATSVSKLTAGKKQLTVTWKRQKAQTPYYQIQYSTDKNFKKNVKTVKIKKNATVKKTIKKLKSNKTYYVRVRTYKTVNKKTYYSTWSKAKKVKVK